MNLPVFDLHCDTALELLGRDDELPSSPVMHSALHASQPRLCRIG